MPARVEFRLGSIFDEPCDLLVIPSSARGTVAPEIEQRLRLSGLPFPDAMPWGTVSVVDTLHAGFGAVAYAAAVSEQRSTPEIVEKIGQALGVLSGTRRYRKISAPLLGAGSGHVAPNLATGALTRGFMSTAPEGALLVISIRDPNRLAALAQAFPHAVANHIQRPAMPSAESEWLQQRLQRLTSVTSAPHAPAGDTQRKGVFISYCHADAEWLARLQKHLKPLQREGIEVWDDTRLKAGERWREEIRQALAAAKVAILLVSADFLASEFIVTNELPRLLKAAEEEGATILPVILSPCRFTRMESLSRFQAVNDPAKPLLKMGRANREEVLDDVARAVEDALKR
jgi:hypothetical protein